MTAPWHGMPKTGRSLCVKGRFCGWMKTGGTYTITALPPEKSGRNAEGGKEEEEKNIQVL